MESLTLEKIAAEIQREWDPEVDGRKLGKDKIAAILRTAFEIILKNDKTVLRGFGTFRWHLAKEKKARNPKTGETLIVPSRKVFKFKSVAPKREV